MVLVDTSVWVRHLRSHDGALASLLDQGLVSCHPFVVGELACGDLTSRDELLGLLRALPSAEVANFDEVLALIEARELAGRGLGYVDVHLIAGALLSHTLLWTADRALVRAAERVGIAYSP